MQIAVRLFRVKASQSVNRSAYLNPGKRTDKRLVGRNMTGSRAQESINANGPRKANQLRHPVHQIESYAFPSN